MFLKLESFWLLYQLQYLFTHVTPEGKMNTSLQSSSSQAHLKVSFCWKGSEQGVGGA